MRLRTLAPLTLAILAPLPPAAAVAGQCITYDQTGAVTGTVVECARDLRTSYAIETLEMRMMGIAQSQNRHVIRKDGEIISWDLETLQGTRTADPLAPDLDGEAEDIARQYIAAMGFTPAGEARTIAGEQCEVYSSPQMGRVCLTPDLLLLEQSFEGMGPASFTRTAVEVDRGTEGAAANYTVPADVTLREVDLGGGLGGLMGSGGNAPPGGAEPPDGVDLEGMLGGLFGGD